MIDRRQLLTQTTVLGAGVAALGTGALAAQSPNEKIVIGVMGVNGRGRDLISGFTAVGAEIAYIADVDERALNRALDLAAGKQSKRPQGVRDFRKILDDKDVDALVIAAPDHWHAPATILAASAGKHVYCEKPACHNPHEGEVAIEAARRRNRVVQIGTQRRSMPGVQEAIQKLKDGAIGRALMARGWYNNTRASIGHGKPAPVPEWLDYSLWQGPAPEKPYQDNLIHYNWHWFWNWGTGELGNNGIHSLDVCRWGLGVEYPKRVTASGGRYWYDDDWQTPDTMVTSYDFGDKMITWEGRSCQPRGFEGSDFGIAFYGDQGTMIVDGGKYRILDLKNKEVAQGGGSSSDQPHQQNFLECIRSGKRPNADVEEGVKSTLLCHLGNIAWRTGHTLEIDPVNGHILNDKEAQALWKREYRRGWEPRI